MCVARAEDFSWVLGPFGLLQQMGAPWPQGKGWAPGGLCGDQGAWRSRGQLGTVDAEGHKSPYVAPDQSMGAGSADATQTHPRLLLGWGAGRAGGQAATGSLCASSAPAVGHRSGHGRDVTQGVALSGSSSSPTILYTGELSKGWMWGS